MNEEPTYYCCGTCKQRNLDPVWGEERKGVQVIFTPYCNDCGIPETEPSGTTPRKEIS